MGYVMSPNETDSERILSWHPPASKGAGLSPGVSRAGQSWRLRV